MAVLSFTISSLLALGGMTLAIIGIVVEAWQPAIAGFVLLLGAGVFATLYLGARRRTGARSQE